MRLKKHTNGIYYAHFASKDGPTSMSLGTRSIDSAKQLARDAKIEEIETAARINVLTSEAITRITCGGRLTFDDATEQWLTWAELIGLAALTRTRYHGYITMFRDQFGLGGQPVSTITVTQVDTFVNPRSNAISAATRSSRRSALQSFFAHATAKGIVHADPTVGLRIKIAGLTFEQKEGRTVLPFTHDEVVSLREIEDPFWKTAVLLGSDFGMRLSDCASLEWSSFNKSGRIIFWTDKRDRRIEMDLTLDVESAILETQKTDPRFVFPEQAATIAHPVRRATLSTAFSRLLKKHGITGKSFHSLRHYYASRRAGHGDSIDEIRISLGHQSVETTKNYLGTL